MNKKNFILIIGHGRGGTSATMGLLNLSPNINIAFEENLLILQGDNPKVYAGEGVEFSWDSDLARRKVSDVYNGNKIILNRYFIPAERIIESVKKKLVILHDRFEDLKIIFVFRDKEDTIASITNRQEGALRAWAEEIWKINEVELDKLRDHFHGNCFSVNFYDLLINSSVKKSLFNYVGEEYDPAYAGMEIDSIGYGKQKLAIENLRFCSIGSENKVDEIPAPKIKPKAKKQTKPKAKPKAKRKVVKKKVKK